MLFQTLDTKKECASVYVGGKITDDYEIDTLTGTWSPSPHYKGLNYASIWAAGESLDACCPDELKEEWEYVNKKAAAFLNSFRNGKVDLKEVCFYDLIPESFLTQFYSLKNKITSHVFETYKRPSNHDFVSDLILFLKRLESQKLNLDFKNLDMTNSKVRNALPKIKNSPNHVSYNAWGTITGRLTTNKNSFPILTLNRELRPVIRPTNDCFVELDYNAAEIRVLFALLGQDQPSEDVHEWISSNIFDNKYDRDESKKKVFAWLYNPKAKNKKLNDYLNRDALYDKYYIDGKVKTPYGREIQVDEDKAVNYLIQSTTSDLFLTSALKVDKMLQGRKSKVCFCIHDSLVLDYDSSERAIVEEIINQFSNTRYGFFKTNFSLGRDFGSMRKVR